MEFEITHVTNYAYGHPAAEAYGEARLTPPNRPGQRILRHSTTIDPVTKLSKYVDYFGNEVQFFSLPFRHTKLVVTNQILVETQRVEWPADSLDVRIEEARQILSSALTDIFDYLQPT